MQRWPSWMTTHAPAAAMLDVRSEPSPCGHIAQTVAFYPPRDRFGRWLLRLLHGRQDLRSPASASASAPLSHKRFIFDYAVAATEFGVSIALKQEYLDAARRGLRYLRDVRHDPHLAVKPLSAILSRKSASSRPTCATSTSG
jgi:hypothetical protein